MEDNKGSKKMDMDRIVQFITADTTVSLRACQSGRGGKGGPETGSQELGERERKKASPRNHNESGQLSITKARHGKPNPDTQTKARMAKKWTRNKKGENGAFG